MGAWKDLWKETAEVNLEYQYGSEHIWITCHSQASWGRVTLNVLGVGRRSLAILIGMRKYLYATVVLRYYTTQDTFSNLEARHPAKHCRNAKNCACGHQSSCH